MLSIPINLTALNPQYECGEIGEHNARQLVIDVTSLVDNADFLVAVFKNTNAETYCSERYYTSGTHDKMVVTSEGVSTISVSLSQWVTQTARESAIVEAYAEDSETHDITLLHKSPIFRLSFDGSIDDREALIEPPVEGLYKELVELEANMREAYDNCVEATGNANEAASNADGKATLADNAATSANAAASSANIAAAAADNVDADMTEIEDGARVSITNSSGQTKTVDLTNGTDGQDGQDGISPTVSVSEISGGHQVTITDSTEHTFNVMDGEDGADGTDGEDGTDGYSPTVSITPITGGHRITITDINGTHTVDIMDGADGRTYTVDGTTIDGTNDVLKIKDGGVGTSQLAANAVNVYKLANDAVENGKIKNLAVTTDKLNDGAVTTPKIAAGAVTTSKLNDGAVENAKLGNLAVTTAKINDGAVTTDKLGVSAVTTVKINDGAVTYEKLASAVQSLFASVFRFKGVKATTSELPATGNNVGDVWTVTADGSEWVWIEETVEEVTTGRWLDLGISIDLSPYLTKTEAASTYLAQATASATYQLKSGRGQLDLSLNTSSSPKDIADISAGFYDVVKGGYICAAPNESNPNQRKRQLPTGSFLYTDGTYSLFIAVDGETYLVDNAGSVYTSWGDGIHIDRKTLESYCSAFLVSSVAAETYLSKTDASSGYQPKNRYITNTAVALADWNEEVTPTYADYPYKATIQITGVTANDYAHIVWGETNIDKLYPNCNTVQGGVEIFASEPVAITIPTIKIEG